MLQALKMEAISLKIVTLRPSKQVVSNTINCLFWHYG
jgi:hypothetical protein